MRLVNIAHMQAVMREFMMLDLISIINNKNRLWFSITQDDFKIIKQDMQLQDMQLQLQMGKSWKLHQQEQSKLRQIHM